MAVKRRVLWALDGDNKTRYMMMPQDATLQSFLTVVRARNASVELNHIWINGAVVDLDDTIDDHWAPTQVFMISSRAAPGHIARVANPNETIGPVNENTIGQVKSEFAAPTEPDAGQFRVFTTLNYASMTEGFDVAIDASCTVAEVTDILLPLVLQRGCPIDDPQLIVYLAGGVPFLGGRWVTSPVWLRARNGFFMSLLLGVSRPHC
jgi:hypothetical protein